MHSSVRVKKIIKLSISTNYNFIWVYLVLNRMLLVSFYFFDYKSNSKLYYYDVFIVSLSNYLQILTEGLFDC